MKWYLGASLHGGLAKTADPHRDPHAETSGRKQWKQGRGRVFQFQRKRSKTSGKRYFQNFSTLCNQQVGGSSPSTSSNLSAAQQSEYGGIPEWPKGADCKSVVSDFGGSNPPSPTKNSEHPSGWSEFFDFRRRWIRKAALGDSPVDCRNRRGFFRRKSESTFLLGFAGECGKPA